MADHHAEGVRSKAHFLGHPIHPMIIPFPIAFLTGALVTDIAFATNGEAFWARFSWWLILAGLVTGAFAAIFGLIDFFGLQRPREHRAGWVHFVGNATVLVLAAVNLFIRNPADGTSIVPVGLVISAVVALLLVITGWYGGELSYRHKVGVT